MKAEIISVGTELLLGDIVNTNAQFLSREMACLGINVYFQTTVGDNAERLQEALHLAVSRSNVILITGGLGPTKDDLTKETVCQAFGLRLREDPQTRANLENYFKQLGRTMSESNLKQAQIPEGAVVFKNYHGTAPGLAVESGQQCIILLPGPPDELEPMFKNEVTRFLERYTDGVIFSHTVHLFGIGESVAAERLGKLLDGENPTVAPYAKTGEVQLRVTARAENRTEAEALIRPVLREIFQMFGRNVYGIDKENLQQAAVEELQKKGCSVATAESCTAGLLSKRITDIPGASEVFEMGVVTYSNESKTSLLGVPSELIVQYGAVSRQVAESMAKGVRRISGADIGIGITGIAGPHGGSPEKPVGLVFIALCDNQKTFVRKINAPRNREYVRTFASSNALYMLVDYLKHGSTYSDFTQPLLQDTIHYHSPVSDAEAGVLPDVSDLFDSEAQAKTRQVETAREDPEPVDIRSSSKDGVLEEDFNAYDTDGIQVREESLLKREKEKKKPWIVRFLKFFIPWPGDRAGEVIRKILFLIALTVFIVSGVYLAQYFLQGVENQDKLDNLASIYHQAPEEEAVSKFAALLEQNSETIGWIKVENTKVDNPVVKTTEDNRDFYLKHGFHKEETRYGTLYVDESCVITQAESSQNITIYGHNMRDGSMFGELTNYKNLDFYKENPTFTFDTLYRDSTYKVFSVFITTADPAEDNGKIFHYRPVDFASEEDFMSWIAQVQHRSLFDLPVDIQPDDEILTLSTCTYDISGADLRFVVVARRVRDGESEAVNTGEAMWSPQILYPQIWYDKYGGSKPVFGDEQEGEKWYVVPSADSAGSLPAQE